MTTRLQSLGRLVVSAVLWMCVLLAAIGSGDVQTIGLCDISMVVAVLVDVPADALP